MHVCIAFLSIFSMLDSSSLLSDGDFDVVSKLSSAALARADIKAFAKSKHNAMFLFLSIRLQYVFLESANVFLTSIFQLVSFVPYESPILGQILDLISPPKLNLFETRFEFYDPWDMVSCLS